MSKERSATVYEPWVAPASQPLDETAAIHGVTGASREASQREMAYDRDINRGGFAQPLPPPPELRAPHLPDDHAQRVATLTQKILERGVAIDRSKLVSLGRMRFKSLLAAERLARAERCIGTRTDLTSFSSILFALSQAGALAPVPQPSMSEQLAGLDTQLDAARKVDGFADLWKLSGAEPRAVRAIFTFHDQFEALVFGQSLLTWIEDNGRIYHKFFARGSGDKASYFNAWLPALKGTHYRINICNSLPAIMFWLAGEKSAPPEPHDLAQEWFGVRVPSPSQITFAAALFEGFLLSHKEWPLWQHIGRATRTLPDKSIIEGYSEQLRKRYGKVGVFHEQVAASFFKPVGDHRELEPARHRQFLNVTFSQLRNCACAVAALAVEENSPANAAPVVARFRDQILCVGKPKPQLAERIAAQLEGTFPNSAFKLQIE